MFVNLFTVVHIIAAVADAFASSISYIPICRALVLNRISKFYDIHVAQTEFSVNLLHFLSFLLYQPMIGLAIDLTFLKNLTLQPAL